MCIRDSLWATALRPEGSEEVRQQEHPTRAEAELNELARGVHSQVRPERRHGHLQHKPEIQIGATDRKDRRIRDREPEPHQSDDLPEPKTVQLGRQGLL